jgi:nicotinate-nucleotide adenylyltransferase
MRLGLLGGTFDPVHFAHLLLAEQCREACRLDQVWFLPSGRPPHKPNETISPSEARIEMLELAVAGHPGFSVCTLEIERGGTTYTVDTLEHLHRDDPTRELFFLIGADSLADLPSWREPERIVQLATIVAVNRGDRPLPDSSALMGQKGLQPASPIRFVTMPGVDLSSSDIRQRVHAGRSIRYMTPPAVEVYIRERSLYRD